MIGKQHKIMTFSLSSLVVMFMCYVKNYHPAYTLIIPVATYFSTFPDIDQAMSVPKEWRTVKAILQFLIPAVFFAAIGLLIYSITKYIDATDYDTASNYLYGITSSFIVLAAYAIAYFYIKTDGKFLTAHRGFTHTLFVPFILGALYVSIDKSVIILEVIAGLCLAICIGWTLHILEDSFCKAGVPLLWPISKSSISFGWAKTGGNKNVYGSVHYSSWVYTIILTAVGLFGIILIYLYM